MTYYRIKVSDDSDSITFRLPTRRNEVGEFVIKCYKNGKRYEAGDYFADDWEDAVGTLKNYLAPQYGLKIEKKSTVYVADSAMSDRRKPGYYRTVGRYKTKEGRIVKIIESNPYMRGPIGTNMWLNYDGKILSLEDFGITDFRGDGGFVFWMEAIKNGEVDSKLHDFDAAESAKDALDPKKVEFAVLDRDRRVEKIYPTYEEAHEWYADFDIHPIVGGKYRTGDRVDRRDIIKPGDDLAAKNFAKALNKFEIRDDSDYSIFQEGSNYVIKGKEGKPVSVSSDREKSMRRMENLNEGKPIEDDKVDSKLLEEAKHAFEEAKTKHYGKFHKNPAKKEIAIWIWQHPYLYPSFAKEKRRMIEKTDEEQAWPNFQDLVWNVLADAGYVNENYSDSKKITKSQLIKDVTSRYFQYIKEQWGIDDPDNFDCSVYSKGGKIYVTGEFGYDDLMTIADVLNPIVAKYNKDSYFEPEDSGRLVSWIND